MTIGSLFKKLSQAAAEENVVANLSAVFMDLLEALAQFAGIDFLTFYHELITKLNLYENLSCLGIIKKSQAT